MSTIWHEPRQAQPARLLVADDDRPLVQSIERALNSAGFGVSVRCATDFAAALEAVRQEPFDGAAVDYLLDAEKRAGAPTGLDLIVELLAIQPRLPIVLITAWGGKETAFEAGQAGAVAYLEKPFTVPELMQALAAPRPSQHVATLELAKRDHVARVLRLCGGKKATAARLLGIRRATLQRILKKEPAH